MRPRGLEMTPGTTRSEMASLRGGTGGHRMDPIHTFVRHFGRARYEDLSAKVVETVKMTILDTMGAALAGSASDAGRGIVQIAKGYGGGTGSTVVVHGGKVAPPLAVLANGIM